MSNVPRRKFVRVYYVDLERDYPDIFFDPTALSTWLRLLVNADKVWPTIPQLPPAVRRSDLAKLKSSGLVCLQPNHRYVIKGYDTERAIRNANARKAAAASHADADAAA